MTRRRKILLLAAFLMLGLGAVMCSFALRSPGLIYQGKSAHEWFDIYRGYRGSRNVSGARSGPRPNDEAELALVSMGTNVVPYLASRISRNLKPSVLDLCRFQLQSLVARSRKTSVPIPDRLGDARSAAKLLFDRLTPSGEQLVPLLDSALRSPKQEQRLIAFVALQSISSGYDLAQPYILQALTDPDPQVQAAAADVVRYFGPGHGGWAVAPLSKLLDRQHPAVFQPVVMALHCLESNSLPALPLLKRRLATEQNQQNREFIAHSIRYISHFAPGQSE